MRSERYKEVMEPINEARRYVDEARQALEGQYDEELETYIDKEPVRVAGNTLWLAVLTAVDAAFQLKNPESLYINDYRNAIGKQDDMLLSLFNQAYQQLPRGMVFDGIQDKEYCDEGFRLANEIIDRCGKMFISTQF